MAIQIPRHLFLLFFVFTPSILTLPSITYSDSSLIGSLESRDTDDTVIIKGNNGKPVQMNLWPDEACGKTKGQKPAPNSNSIVNPVEYGVDYSLKEQPHYDQAPAGIFNSFSINRDIESNEQIDFSTYVAPGAVVTNPGHPGCSHYVGSQGGNLSLGVKAHDCMGITAACFKIWRA